MGTAVGVAVGLFVGALVGAVDGEDVGFIVLFPRPRVGSFVVGHFVVNHDGVGEAVSGSVGAEVTLSVGAEVTFPIALVGCSVSRFFRVGEAVTMVGDSVT